MPCILCAQSVYQETLFEGVTGNALLDSLASNYKPSSVLSYDEARDIMFTEIYNENNSVTCIYTGDTIFLDANSDSPRQDALDEQWNTEHIWPQSKGAGMGNARADLHHLQPIRADVNSSRGNSPFGHIPPDEATRWWRYDVNQTSIPEYDITTWSRTRGNSEFQVRDAKKGEAARAMFYFYTMYQTLADETDPTYFKNQVKALRTYHDNATVSDIEVKRTFQIAAYQDGKPNPFVIDTTLVRRVFFENFDFDEQIVDGEYTANFETVTKNQFSDGTISINGVSWLFSNALIGSSDGDMKFDERSARLRHQTDKPARIEMLGDKTNGLGTVQFYYSRSDFNEDRQPTSPIFVVEYSTDQGEKWHQLGEKIDLDGVNQLTLFEESVNTTKNGRIRIKSISGSDGRRFNIDNLFIGNYEQTHLALSITGREGWRMLSSPVKNQTLKELLSNIFTQGFPGADFEGDHHQSNVLLYNPVEKKYSKPSSINKSLHPGEAVLVYIFENDEPGSSQTENLLRTIEVSGTEPESFFYDLHFNEYSELEYNGWNFVGNPFGIPLAVADLEILDNPALNNYIYIWDSNKGEDGEYRILSADETEDSISPFQGFWVKTTESNQQLHFTRDASTTESEFYKSAEEQSKLEISFNGNVDISSSTLYFSENGQHKLHSGDAYRLAPLTDIYSQTFFKKQETELAIANYPLQLKDKLTVPLHIQSTQTADGFLTIETDHLPNGFQIIIEDVINNDFYSLEDEIPIHLGHQSAKTRSRNSGFQKSVTTKEKVFLVHITPKENTQQKPSDIPEKVSLAQNYPNPFNPSTVINYSIPESQHVRIELYDMLGRRVSTLVNEVISAGNHQVELNANHLSSGVYLYKMDTADSVLTRRLTLTK